jgi:hypothetical protein
MPTHALRVKFAARRVLPYRDSQNSKAVCKIEICWLDRDFSNGNS